MTGKNILGITGGLFVAYWIGKRIGLNMVQKTIKEPTQVQQTQQTGLIKQPVNLPPQNLKKECFNQC